MIRQWLRRKLKIAYGAYRTVWKSDTVAYNPNGWWDSYVYPLGVSDRQTISPEKDLISARYHYASVEVLILRHLVNSGFPLRDCSVFDIGSGAGHWIEFYLGLGAGRCVGIDVAERSADHIRERYAGDDRVEMHHGLFQDFLEQDDGRYDVINAIGVLFHVVEDSEWERGLRAIASSLREGGLLVVGGHFGWSHNINVQFDDHSAVNKRLRSRGCWKRALRRLGFDEMGLYPNRAYLHIRDTIPEANLLIARR